jgi:hypothetical protein
MEPVLCGFGQLVFKEEVHYAQSTFCCCKQVDGEPNARYFLPPQSGFRSTFHLPWSKLFLVCVLLSFPNDRLLLWFALPGMHNKCDFFKSAG